MKILHLSIMAIVGIVVIAATTAGVFLEKLGENQQQPYTGIVINGMKENYTVHEPIVFSVSVEGYGTGCGDTKAIIKKENDSQFNSPVWGFGQQCASGIQYHNFKFNALPVNTTINRSGNYTLTASFDDSITNHHTQTDERFSVRPYVITGITTTSVKDVNTDFVIDEQKARLLAENSVDELKNISYGCHFDGILGISGTGSNSSKLQYIQVGYNCDKYVGAFVVIEDPLLTKIINVTTYPITYHGP